MASPRDSLLLPDSLKSGGDPVEGNPFPTADPRHAVWGAATRAAEEALCRFDVEHDVDADWVAGRDFLHEHVRARFNAWAHRGLCVVATEATLRSHDEWLVSYANSWLREVAAFYERNPPPVAAEELLASLRSQLARQVQYWKAEARQVLSERMADLHARLATPDASRVNAAVVARRRRILSDYRRKHDLSAEALARRVAISDSAIRAIVREDTSKFKQGTRDKLLTKLGLALPEWYGL